MATEASYSWRKRERLGRVWGDEAGGYAQAGWVLEDGHGAMPVLAIVTQSSYHGIYWRVRTAQGMRHGYCLRLEDAFHQANNLVLEDSIGGH